MIHSKSQFLSNEMLLKKKLLCYSCINTYTRRVGLKPADLLQTGHVCGIYTKPENRRFLQSTADGHRLPQIVNGMQYPRR